MTPNSVKKVKEIVIMGSTGSVGTQAIDVIRLLNYKILGLGCGSNIELLLKQIEEFGVKIVSVASAADAIRLKRLLDENNIQNVDIFYGEDGLINLARIKCDIFINSIMGIKGLMPTLEAIRNGSNVAIANKEPIVAAGRLIMAEAMKYNVNIIPVDSEHSAVFQCISGKIDTPVKNIILTASGGPFRNKTKEELDNVTLEEALMHPTWKMGSKITIDCATLMNKGLEVIEAMNLYNLSSKDVKVVIHPQSIIHSMVTFYDESVLAQLSVPDMKLPIQYALTYPERYTSDTKPLDLIKSGPLTFEEPDMERFPCLAIAYRAAEIGGTMPAVMNAANEQVVNYFLKGQKFLKFCLLPPLVLHL